MRNPLRALADKVKRDFTVPDPATPEGAARIAAMRERQERTLARLSEFEARMRPTAPEPAAPPLDLTAPQPAALDRLSALLGLCLGILLAVYLTPLQTVGWLAVAAIFWNRMPARWLVAAATVAAWYALLPSPAAAAGVWDFLGSYEKEQMFKEAGRLLGILDGRLTPAGKIISVLNTIFLAVGCAFVTIHIAIGVASTAHSGEVLGQRWSSLWGPLRAILGIAMLVPAYNGFSMAQVAVLHVSGWGMGLASQLVTAAYDDAEKGGTLTPFRVPDSVVMDVLSVSLNGYACASEINYQYSLGNNRQGPAVIVNARGTTMSFDGASYTNYPPAVCGAIAVPRGPLAAAHAAAAMKAIHRLDVASLASDITWNRHHDKKVSLAKYRGLVNDAVRVYSQEIESAAEVYAKTVKKTKVQKPTRIDWIEAGALHLRKIEMSHEITDAIAAVPVTASFSTARLDDYHTRSQVELTVNAARRFLADDILQYKIASNATAAAALPKSNILSEFLDPYNRLSWIRSGVIEVLKTSPLTHLSDMGHKIITNLFMSVAAVSAGIGIAAAGLGAGAGNIFGKLVGGDTALLATMQGLSYVFQVFGGMIGSQFSILLAAGVFLAYVLPNMVFLLWIFACARYFIFVLEAVVSAPLWAIAHARMDGQELIEGPQSQGYQMLISIFLRPSLMLVGLFLSIEMFELFAGLLAALFPVAFDVSQTETSFVGLTGLVAYLGMAVYAAYQLFKLSIGLIIPPRLSIDTWEPRIAGEGA